MKTKLPILVIIPHGGREVPDEFSGLIQIDDFGIFIESDAYANDLFDFKNVQAKFDTNISRLFIDLDRDPAFITNNTPDGVIKKESISGRKVFREGVYPDDIAFSNILKRYYTPFHNSIRQSITGGEIKFILECHTMMPVGPRFAKDAGKPRPLINIENIIDRESRPRLTCTQEKAEYFLSCFKKYFSSEEFTVSAKFSLNKPKSAGFILEKYGQHKIPMLRFSISSSLYLNDKFFNYEHLTIDKKRIMELKGKIWAGIEKYTLKYL
jgi:N-formylglutamate amidohydrolase